MKDETLKHLFDIREAASAILRFVKNKTFDDYNREELLRFGVERKFEIIGEALTRIKRTDPAALNKIGEHCFFQKYFSLWLRQHRPQNRVGNYS